VDCRRVDEELIGFHLAALDGATRAAVEAHLCACARCVGAYLMVKRAVDAGEDAPAPSELTRARVHEAARAQLGATAAAPSARAPLGRRVALWATAAAMLVAAPLVYRAVRPPADTRPPSPSVPSTPQRAADAVDTARTTPESLQFL
jgi:hypothetical protein